MAASETTPSMEQRRQAMVAEIRAKNIPLPPALEEAFLTVPRHLFLPGIFLDAVYHDQIIVTKRDRDGVPVSSSSDPSTMAVMLNALKLREGQNILEVGTGSGYNAAMLSELVGPTGLVTSIEIDDEIADAAVAHLARAGYPGVQVICADASKGYAANAPYDRIVVTASTWDLPTNLADQLKDDGIIVVPLDFGGISIGAVLRKQPDDTLESTMLFAHNFVPLQGEAAGPHREVRIPASALSIKFGEGTRAVDPATIHTMLREDHEMAQFPLELESENLGMFSYYMLFRQPEDYQFVTYDVEPDQMAYGMWSYGWGIVSQTGACFVPFGDERVLHVYGSSDAYLKLIEVAEAWLKDGRPGFDRSKLRITPAGRKNFLPKSAEDLLRVFVRPTHTYTLWVEAGASHR